VDCSALEDPVIIGPCNSLDCSFGCNGLCKFDCSQSGPDCFFCSPDAGPSPSPNDSPTVAIPPTGTCDATLAQALPQIFNVLNCKCDGSNVVTCSSPQQVCEKNRCVRYSTSLLFESSLHQNLQSIKQCLDYSGDEELDKACVEYTIQQSSDNQFLFSDCSMEYRKDGFAPQSCRSCSICGTGQMNLDCSNIRMDASTNGCESIGQNPLAGGVSLGLFAGFDEAVVDPSKDNVGSGAYTPYLPLSTLGALWLATTVIVRI